MVTKYIMLEFADGKHRAIDSINDIRKATKHASMNLYSRHGVQLGYPMPYQDRVIVDIGIPDSDSDSFKVGYHLRGISTYMLGLSEKHYDSYLVGNRLFNYYEVSNPSDNSLASYFDKLDLLSQIISILQRDDDEARLFSVKLLELLRPFSNTLM